MNDNHLFQARYKDSVIRAESKEAVDELVSHLNHADAVERETKRRWPGTTPEERMSALAGRFPSMRDIPGADPWDEVAILHWCNSGAPTGGSRWAARFLLAVWNPHTDWTTTEPALTSDGRFDLFQAWNAWDDEHRAAAMEWLQYPFYP